MNRKPSISRKDDYWTDERRLLALEAVWELEALGKLLPKIVPLKGEDNEAPLQVQGISARLCTPASALMTAIDDEPVPPSEIRATLGLV